MKNILLSFTLLLIVSPLWPSSFKFIAMDKYYDKSVPIDSILVNNMNTGEEKLYLTDSIFFETISSVEDISNTNNLQLYPNPVGDILNVNIQNSLNQDLIISDINGRVQYRTPKLNSGQISLNVAGLPQGVYAIRSGNQSQTFVKNTSSNGQEISLLTTSYMPNSLVKEAEVQSQFDYRFTIYSKGFKPYIYNSMALTKDTVVKLDMASLPSILDGKHIRITLSVSKMSIEHTFSQTTAPEHKDIISYDYNEIFIDTLVVRNGKFNLIKYYERVSYDRGFDKRILNFKIDTLNQTISNFTYSNEYDKWYKQGNEDHNDTFKSQLSFSDSVHYNDVNNISVMIYFHEVSPNYYYNKMTSYNTSISLYYQYWKLLSYNPTNSYIKIEFID